MLLQRPSLTGSASRTKTRLAYLVLLGSLLLLAGRLPAEPAHAQRDGDGEASGGDSVHVRRTDARLHALLTSGEKRARAGKDNVARAADRYRRLIASLGSDLSPGDAAVLRRYVAQTAWLLPDDVFGQVVRGDRDASPKTWTFHEGAGEVLLAWWHRQDPVLGTARNERLREHLRRVAHAERAYAAPERLTRIDARGEVYVRYGEPSKRTEVGYNEASFIKKVYRFGVPVSMSDFPKNELWLYPHIDEAGYYLFIENGSSYRLARSTNDLLPPQLRKGFSRSERSLNKAVSSMAALRHIYRRLAMHHIDFGARYKEVDDYVAMQEEAEMGMISSSGQRRRRVGAGIGGQEAVVTKDPFIGMVLPSEKIRETLNRSRMADERAARRRKKNMPRQHTEVLDEAASLPIAVRTARFLEEDGHTRTEVYWGVRPGALRLTKRQRKTYGARQVARSLPMITFTAMRQGESYEQEEMRRKKYLLKGRVLEEGARTVPPQQVTFDGATGTYHIGLQWMERLARVRGDSAGSRVAAGPVVKTGMRRFDSLQALSAGGGRLEMSDLRPMVLPDAANAPATGDLMKAAVRYPFARVAPDTPLLLSVEVYHLAYNADDRTRYTVEYEVQRRTERGGLARLFRGDRQESTSTQTTYAGSSRTAEEFILLELGEWEQGQEGALEIVVRITDETTGQQVERSIEFEVGAL